MYIDIEDVVNDLFKDINIEKLKQDDFLYYIFCKESLDIIDINSKKCLVYKDAFEEGIKLFSKKIY